MRPRWVRVLDLFCKPVTAAVDVALALSLARLIFLQGEWVWASALGFWISFAKYAVYWQAKQARREKKLILKSFRMMEKQFRMGFEPRMNGAQAPKEDDGSDRLVH